MRNNQEKQELSRGTFFQHLVVGGNALTADEAEKQGINLNAKSGKPLFSGNVDKPVSLFQTYKGFTFKGNVDDLLNMLNAKNEPENESDTDSESMCTPTG